MTSGLKLNCGKKRNPARKFCYNNFKVVTYIKMFAISAVEHFTKVLDI